VGVTGHRVLTPEVEAFVRRELEVFLGGRGQRESGAELVGLSCLSAGADQLFAGMVLEAGGSVEAHIPSRDYREVLPQEARPEFDRLLAAASRRHHHPFLASGPPAYMAASLAMLADASELVAVWDGLPARGPGGTGEVVARARAMGLPVTVLWPEGVWR
jgi:hypothetical protein